MRRIGMVLAIAVLAGSILSGCVIEPLDGRYGNQGYHANPGYYADRDFSSGHPGPYYR